MSEDILEKQLIDIIKDKEMAEYLKLAKVDMLVKLGVNVNAMYGARSPLRFAKDNNLEKVAEFLEKNGAKDIIDEEKAEELGGELIIEYICNEPNIDRIKELISKGADIEAKDNEGWTSFMWASCRGHSEVLKLLLEKGADIEAKDRSGWTSLMHASLSGHTEVVKMLLEKGADIEAKNKLGRTSLIWASSKGRSDVVKVLLENGADIEVRDNNGKTALDLVENDETKKMLEDAKKKNNFLYKIKRGFGMGD